MEEVKTSKQCSVNGFLGILKSKPFKIICFVLIISLALCTACFDNRKVPLFVPDLIGTEDCKPPCWNGIVPGETSDHEAAEIIKLLDIGKLSWERQPDALMVNGENRYILPYQDGVIQQIDITFGDYSRLFLYQIIDHFGEPAGYAEIYSEPGSSFVLFFPTNGLVVFPIGIKNRNIKTNTRISGVIFIPSTGNLEEFMRTFIDSFGDMCWMEECPEYEDVKPWSGYGRLP